MNAFYSFTLSQLRRRLKSCDKKIKILAGKRWTSKWIRWTCFRINQNVKREKIDKNDDSVNERLDKLESLIEGKINKYNVEDNQRW